MHFTCSHTNIQSWHEHSTSRNTYSRCPLVRSTQQQQRSSYMESVSRTQRTFASGSDSQTKRLPTPHNTLLFTCSLLTQLPSEIQHNMWHTKSIIHYAVRATLGGKPTIPKILRSRDELNELYTKNTADWIGPHSAQCAEEEDSKRAEFFTFAEEDSSKQDSQNSRPTLCALPMMWMTFLWPKPKRSHRDHTINNRPIFLWSRTKKNPCIVFEYIFVHTTRSIRTAHSQR